MRNATTELIHQVRAAADDATLNPLLWLLVEAAQSGNEDALAFLIHYVRERLIEQLARKFRAGEALEAGDYEGEGVIAVLEAIRETDPSQQTGSFVAYVYRRVYRKMCLLAGGEVHLSSTGKKNWKRVRASHDRLFARDGQSPWHEAVAEDVNRTREPKDHVSARMVSAILGARDARRSLDDLGDACPDAWVEAPDTEVGLASLLRGGLATCYEAAFRVLKPREVPAFCVLTELRFRAKLTRLEIHALLTEPAPRFSSEPFDESGDALSWAEYHAEARLPASVPTSWAGVADLFRKPSGRLVTDRTLDNWQESGFERLRLAIS